MSHYTVIFQGRLGSDPERKRTPSGVDFVELSVAHKINSGTEHAKTIWTRCSCWGDSVSAKMINSLKKGSFLQVNGYLSDVSSFINKENKPASAIYIKVLGVAYVDYPKPKIENAASVERNTDFLDEVPF